MVLSPILLKNIYNIFINNLQKVDGNWEKPYFSLGKPYYFPRHNCLGGSITDAISTGKSKYTRLLAEEKKGRVNNPTPKIVQKIFSVAEIRVFFPGGGDRDWLDPQQAGDLIFQGEMEVFIIEVGWL
jgi:hypothetical protein